MLISAQFFYVKFNQNRLSQLTIQQTNQNKTALKLGERTSY